MTTDERYMARCLQLAACGRVGAPPNPMVGAVIVHNGRIIGEGYHRQCGGAHAEVNAIASVANEDLLREATIYVSLEPCAHHGKTPPCADLIIEKKIPRVVVGCMDPFSLVAGRGINKLRNAGIEVTVGVLEEACRKLICRFITFHTQKRPYILLKWAQSADGYIDKTRNEGNPVILSTPLTTMLVHKKRAEYTAILVGRKTALLDNPSLTTRHWHGKNPVRLVIDKDLTLPSSLHLFDGSARTWVFTQKNETPQYPNTTFFTLDFSKNIPFQILEVLYREKLQSLIVEGGTTLLQSFIDAGLWDEARIEVSPLCLEEGVKAPCIDKKYISLTKKHFGRNVKYAFNKASK